MTSEQLDEMFEGDFAYTRRADFCFCYHFPVSLIVRIPMKLLVIVFYHRVKIFEDKQYMKKVKVIHNLTIMFISLTCL